MKYLLIALFIIVTGSSIKGTASYYHDRFHGRKTASGQVYDKTKFTAASNKFNLGDSVRVVNLVNNKEIVVFVNDRMAYNGRVIDLSRAAADSLDFIRAGLVKVKVELL